jgi:molybdopterin-guanine dinucleotide biosynthesis protein A
MNKSNIPCIILAGGKSSRMRLKNNTNQDKTKMSFKGFDTIVEYQIDRLKGYFDEIYISSKDEKFDISQAIYLIDKYPNYSPIYAIKSIFESTDLDEFFLIPADSPNISIKSIDKIISASQKYDITVAKTKFRHNLCGVFKRDILPLIDNMIEKDIQKIGYLVQNSSSSYVEFEDENEFININTFDEYQKALQLRVF